MNQQSSIQGKKIILRDWKVEDLVQYEKWLMSGHKWQELDAPYLKQNNDDIPEEVERKRSYIQAIAEDESKIRSSFVISYISEDVFIGRVNSYWRSKETTWLSTLFKMMISCNKNTQASLSV